MDLKALREMDLELARQICLDELSDILTDYTERSVPLAPLLPSHRRSGAGFFSDCLFSHSGRGAVRHPD